MKIELSETQCKCLFELLNELNGIQSSSGCNDVFDEDTILLLSKEERRQAQNLTNNCQRNYTASSYLMDVLNKQKKKSELLKLL